MTSLKSWPHIPQDRCRTKTADAVLCTTSVGAWLRHCIRPHLQAAESAGIEGNHTQLGCTYPSQDYTLEWTDTEVWLQDIHPLAPAEEVPVRINGEIKTVPMPRVPLKPYSQKTEVQRITIDPLGLAQADTKIRGHPNYWQPLPHGSLP